MAFDSNLYAEWIDELKAAWLEKPDVSITQCIVIGLVILVANMVLCAVLWYLQLNNIVEVGYPKRSKRRKREGVLIEIKEHSRIHQISLWKLYKNAPRKNWYVWLSFRFNLLNIPVAATCCIAYPCVIITSGAGWALTLLLFPPYMLFFIVGIVQFIPSLIFLPSERRRYSWK